MNDKVRVIIPCYKREISKEEDISLCRTRDILGHYGITLLAPYGLDLSKIYKVIPDAEEHRMKKEFFDGFGGYNRLMLSPQLYADFLKYEYILICQQDVLVLEDRLKEFIDMAYDYIGAPIPHMGPWSPKLYTGNGGFSLRRVEAVLEFLKKHADDFNSMNDNEDVFYSNAGERYPEDFKTAPIYVSASFASNMYHGRLYELNGKQLPMAVHGYCSGDIEFLKSRVYPLMENEIKSDDIQLRGWDEDWEKFREFIENAKKIAIYGAGDAGIVYKEVIERMGRKTDVFLVSDGQDVMRDIDGVPIFHLSEYQDDYESLSVFIAISFRYKNLPDFEAMLKKRGVRNVFKMSNELWHKGINELIEGAE